MKRGIGFWRTKLLARVQEGKNSNGHPVGVVVRVRNSLIALGAVERLVQLESDAQHGSAAKAVFSLERFCPINSMAPVLAIV